MTTFRPGIIKQIQTEMDNTVFTQHLFKIETKRDGFQMLITLVPNDHYYFKFKKLIPPINNLEYETYEAPGDYELGEQKYQIQQLANVKQRISAWINRVAEDYRITAPEYDDLALQENLWVKL